MIHFFLSPAGSVLALAIDHALTADETERLTYLFGGAQPATNAAGEPLDAVEGYYVGPRREMITPWSTNAVEIAQNMNLCGISRIEEYFPVSGPDADFDPMLQRLYEGLGTGHFHRAH